MLIRFLQLPPWVTIKDVKEKLKLNENKFRKNKNWELTTTLSFGLPRTFSSSALSKLFFPSSSSTAFFKYKERDKNYPPFCDKESSITHPD